MCCRVLFIVTVLLVSVHDTSADECSDGIKKCMQDYMNIAYQAKTAEQYCHYYDTFQKCILLACPELNGTIPYQPEQQKQVDEGMKKIGVNCSAPVGSQGDFHGYTPGPGSSQECVDKTVNCSKWYVNATMNIANLDDLCSNLHTLSSCVKEGCQGVPLAMTPEALHKIEKQFEDQGLQCDVSDLFQVTGSTTPRPSGQQTATGAPVGSQGEFHVSDLFQVTGSTTPRPSGQQTATGSRGNNPSNAADIVIRTRLLPLVTLLAFLLVWL